MTFVASLILSCIAVALVASAAQLTRTRGRSESYDPAGEGTREVESHLLRRPLRSRYSA